ncbi:MAG: ACP S-malonyltransferase [Bacillota bacterium]
MAKIAFLFPGQGSQFVGMGRELYEHFPAARAVFEQAATVLGEELLRIIFSGPVEELQKTENTQPAILTTSLAVCRVMETLGIPAAGAAGLSLGEYSALVAAGALSFEDALPLVRNRGRFMQEAVPLGKGTMAAVMGLPADKVEAVCREAGRAGVVTPANYNCPGQIVISGEVTAVNLASELARQAGAKKVTELKVSAPFHCPLLAPVEAKLERELAALELKTPAVPVVFNVSAGLITDPLQIKASLVKQVSSPILWEQSIRTLLDLEYDTFIEMVPGNSLSKLMKRIDPNVFAATVEDRESLEAVRQHLKEVAERES